MRMYYLLGIKNHFKYKYFLSEKYNSSTIIYKYNYFMCLCNFYLYEFGT